jgi:hypothetical protein
VHLALECRATYERVEELLVDFGHVANGLHFVCSYESTSDPFNQKAYGCGGEEHLHLMDIYRSSFINMPEVRSSGLITRSNSNVTEWRTIEVLDFGDYSNLGFKLKWEIYSPYKLPRARRQA